LTIHELDCIPPRCGRLARGETTIDVRRDAGFEIDDMLHLRERQPKDVRDLKLGEMIGYTGRHVAAHITHIARAEEFPEALRPGYAVLSLELYRTWVDGQAGPGDWSEPVVGVESAR
jgi:hypothetical protein